MNKIIQQLQRIAKANKDSFEYRIDIYPGKEVRYLFRVYETTDNHNFLTVNFNPEKVLLEVDSADLKQQCELWGWKYVE